MFSCGHQGAVQDVKLTLSWTPLAAAGAHHSQLVLPTDLSVYTTGPHIQDITHTLSEDLSLEALQFAHLDLNIQSSILAHNMISVCNGKMWDGFVKSVLLGCHASSDNRLLFTHISNISLHEKLDCQLLGAGLLFSVYRGLYKNSKLPAVLTHKFLCKKVQKTKQNAHMVHRVWAFTRVHAHKNYFPVSRMTNNIIYYSRGRCDLCTHVKTDQQGFLHTDT